jgi:1-deoxy-D-xylulose-5-phosphate reductoisomerase
MAVAHPNWSMGAKISVDSATMMNKGLELIEAMHLFSVAPEDIKIVIHPQSVIHSMIELIDGSVLAQCAAPDMALPIQYALTYPGRLPSGTKALDFSSLKGLTFQEPDFSKTPCLRLAIDAAKRGGSLPCAMNAADEVAVSRFLSGALGYNEIYDCVLSVVGRIDFIKTPSLSDLLETDTLARRLASAYKHI